jgi:hypothetical protein
METRRRARIPRKSPLVFPENFNENQIDRWLSRDGLVIQQVPTDKVVMGYMDPFACLKAAPDPSFRLVVLDG